MKGTVVIEGDSRQAMGGEQSGRWLVGGGEGEKGMVTGERGTMTGERGTMTGERGMVTGGRGTMTGAKAFYS